MGKVKIGLYCYLTADILTKVLQKCSLSSPLANISFLSNPLNLISCHGNQKACVFLLLLLMYFCCYGNLNFPLTYNGKSENWHLLRFHCRYFDKSFLEMFIASQVQLRAKVTPSSHHKYSKIRGKPGVGIDKHTYSLFLNNFLKIMLSILIWHLLTLFYTIIKLFL